MSGSNPYHTVPCFLPQCLASSWAPSRLTRAGHLCGHAAHRIHRSSSRDIRLPPPPVIIHMDENTNLLIFSCPTGWKPYGILASSPGRAAHRIDLSLFSRTIPPPSGPVSPLRPGVPCRAPAYPMAGKSWTPPGRARPRCSTSSRRSRKTDRARRLNSIESPPAQLDRKPAGSTRSKGFQSELHVMVLGARAAVGKPPPIIGFLPFLLQHRGLLLG